jgi:hypothetical protein
MTNITRRSLLKGATAVVTAGAFVTRAAFAPTTVLAQAKPRAKADGIKALVYDVFGTCVDWRSGVARDAERLLKPLGYRIDWLALADAWRALYQPTMEEVRSGRQPFVTLDILHRRMLDQSGRGSAWRSSRTRLSTISTSLGIASIRGPTSCRFRTAEAQVHSGSVLERQHRADGRYRAAQQYSVGRHLGLRNRAGLQAEARRLSDDRGRAEPATTRGHDGRGSQRRSASGSVNGASHRSRRKTGRKWIGDRRSDSARARRFRCDEHGGPGQSARCANEEAAAVRLRVSRCIRTLRTAQSGQKSPVLR